MQQLWLNGRRVDCIDQLRAAMDTAQEEDMDAMCLELIQQYNNHVLSPWLSRQWESCRAAGAESEDVALKMTHQAIEVLRGEIADTDAVEHALAVLADVPLTCFASRQQREKLQKIQTQKNSRMKQLEDQSWFADWKNEFACIGEDDWDYVVMNRKQLAAVLARLRRQPQTNGESVTIYLCGSDEMADDCYHLDLQGIRNVIIRGIHDPKVKYSRWSDQRSTEENNVIFQDLEITCS